MENAANLETVLDKEASLRTNYISKKNYRKFMFGSGPEQIKCAAS